MSRLIPSRAEIRKHLDERFRVDADLDAFCLDHFEDVYRRFSKDMDRTQKVNLLLSVEDPSAVAAQLWPVRRYGLWAVGILILAAMLAGGTYLALPRARPGVPALVMDAAAPARNGSASEVDAAAPARDGSAPVVPSPAPATKGIPTGIGNENEAIDSPDAKIEVKAPSSLVRTPSTAIGNRSRVVNSPGASISVKVGGR